MPTNNTDQALWVQGGNFDSANETSLFTHLGDLGKKATVNGIRYQRVQHDSGATAAAPSGVVAAGQAAYWKVGQEANYIVTNDVRFSAGSYNGVAGVYPFAVTPGNYTFIIKKRQAYPVVVTGATWNVGDIAQMDNTSGVNQATRIAAGTAPPYPGGVLGVVVGALASSKVPVDIDIADLM